MKKRVYYFVGWVVFIVITYFVHGIITIKKHNDFETTELYKSYEEFANISAASHFTWGVGLTSMLGPEYRCSYTEIKWSADDIFMPIYKDEELLGLRLSGYGLLGGDWKPAPLKKRNSSSCPNVSLCSSKVGLGHKGKVLKRARASNNGWIFDGGCYFTFIDNSSGTIEHLNAYFPR